MAYIGIWGGFFLFLYITKKLVKKEDYEGTYELEIFVRNVLAFMVAFLTTIIVFIFK